MTEQKKYDSLMDIVDEAYDLVNERIDSFRTLREKKHLDSRNPVLVREEEESFLKDLRALINLSENFRDD